MHGIAWEGTVEHRSQMWGQKVWDLVLWGLGALLFQWGAPCPLSWDLAYSNPQYPTDGHSLTIQTLQE